jgi:energy-coupling factor transporter transmembrane protein EcfT
MEAINHMYILQITLITLVASIASHLDVYGCLHAIWLFILFAVSRNALRNVWSVFSVYLTVVVLVQYVTLVNLPPAACFRESSITNLRLPWFDNWYKDDE